MKLIYTFLVFFFFSFSIAAQEITINQLFEIVNCKQDANFDYSHCYLKIVKKLNYTRLDGETDKGFSGSSNGLKKKVYGPKSNEIASKIKSVYFGVLNPKTISIIYTDDEEHFNTLKNEVSSSDDFERTPNEEGSTEYKDWVYKQVGETKYQITFINHPGLEEGDFSITVSRRWY